ncbi:MAG: bifunctional metallophosphatase/5'-nucleotidase [Anaerolineales bacterium]|nr:bifunctional metallophosphatase/5'-nucleotidase [Anaerolineales bacterium]
MTTTRIRSLLHTLFLLLLLTSCAEAPDPTAAPQPTNTAVLTATAILEATPISPTPEPARQLTLLYTNDEHGWLAGTEPGRGAANLLGLWQTQEGYTPDGPFLVLSGGDMWTGPAVSTWFDGESMAAVMNAMGYAAAAVGNHEFDFGLDQLAVRAAQSDFPFLSANVRYRDNGRSPLDLGIQPYAIVEAAGLRVGLIGLTSLSTPRTTSPANVAAFEFIPYETALRETVPRVLADGADLLVVLAHACRAELEELAPRVADLGITVITAGHCNELFATQQNGITLVGGGAHLASYARVTLTVQGDEVTAAADTAVNEGGAADTAVAAIVQTWQEAAEAELSFVIGYTETGIARRSAEMEALITAAWLAGYPAADVAITNSGGIRADIPPGDITLADVIGVMPFDNVLVEVELDGRQLEQVLSLADDDAIGGVRRERLRWVLQRDGAEIERDAAYHLLVNDFMYAGGDQYALLARLDPDAYNTAIDWRQPVIDWITAQQTSPAQPLEAALADLLTNQ